MDCSDYGDGDRRLCVDGFTGRPNPNQKGQTGSEYGHQDKPHLSSMTLDLGCVLNGF
jgi:hypothetical protein